MDYTPISARRVVLGFSLTIMMALLPLAAVSMSSTTWSLGFLGLGGDGYRGLVLVVGSTVVAMTFAALATVVWQAARRVSRRPSGA